MNFYTRQHKHYCGIDLHAKAMYVCILDQAGTILVHKNLPTTPETFLRIIAPYRKDLVGGVECIFTWYWLADLCAKEKIPFVLGHALSMKAIHEGKAKNDKIDAYKSAVLLRDGMLPQAYVYPAEMRATRDLLRRCCPLVRKRAELLGLDRDQWDGHAFTRVRIKSNRRLKTVPITAEARKAVEEWLKKRGEEPGPIFLTARRRRLGRKQLYEILKQVERQANTHLPTKEQFTVTPHVLRHTFLRKLAETKGIQYAKEASGHKTDRYIWRYVKPDQQTLAQAIDGLE